MKNIDKIWTQDEIKKLLETRPDFVKRSLVKMYNRQIDLEKRTKQTRVYNGDGFNKPDGYKLSSFAEFYNRNGYLTNKQIYVVRKRLMKYSNQLTNIANSINKI